MEDKFEIGEIVIYKPDYDTNAMEIGEIKRICDDGCFVYYHKGDTAAKTEFKNLVKIKNLYAFEIKRRKCEI